MVANPQTFGSNKTDYRIEEVGQAEQRLPYWARSKNPIVRRHLGLYWRTVPPDAQPFLIIFGVWSFIMLSGVVLPGLFAISMISFLASIMVIPVAFVMYAQVLLTVTIEAARFMQMEMNNNTFNLLRTTPMSLSQIFLGKVAAALWKRVDDMVLVAQMAAAFSPPLIFSIYSDVWHMTGGIGNIIAPALSLVTLLAIVLRIFIEPIMMGVIAVFIGIVVPGRSRAITSSVVVGAFYFLLLNIASRLPVVRGYETPDSTIIPPNGTLILLFDIVIPIALPIIIIFALLKLGERIIKTS